jgi:hypothetical protein
MPPAEPEKKKAKAAAARKLGKNKDVLLFGPPSQRAAKTAALSDIKKSLHAGKRGSRALQRKGGGASDSSSQQSSGSTRAPAHAKRKVGRSSLVLTGASVFGKENLHFEGLDSTTRESSVCHQKFAKDISWLSRHLRLQFLVISPAKKQQGWFRER